MAANPIALSELHSRDGSWTDWLDQFSSSAEVNHLDEEAQRLLLHVTLTSHALLAYKCLPDEIKGSFDLTLQL